MRCREMDLYKKLMTERVGERELSSVQPLEKW